VFGPVTTLQNVAVISSAQMTPVVGASDTAGWPVWVPCWSFDVATWATAGAAAKSNAAINASFFIYAHLNAVPA
jgi:hypothetical protein